MPSTAKHYVTSLGVVLLAMLMYRWLLVPTMEPPARQPVKQVEFNTGLQSNAWWQRLFPVASWQHNSPKVLQTPRGILLFTECHQLGPDQWRLEPLTMIIPQSQSDSTNELSDLDSSMADQDVWIVNADKGAVIQFREAFDWTKGRTPPVMGGRLEGQINITRRTQAPTEDRPWHLTTSDVQIDRRQILTFKPVEIRWDNSIIRGRELSIMLKQDLLSDSQDDTSPWGVLESMELNYIDEINVALPPGGLWADMKQSSPRLPNLQGLPANLRVQSGGPFRFDFISSEASLMNGVHATHQVGSLPPDLFSSQELKVELTPVQSGANAPPPQGAVMLGGLQLKQLTAVGMDPVAPIVGQTIVKIDAPNIGTSVNAKKLKANFTDFQLELVGRLDGPQAASTVSRLDYLDYSFRSPSIAYKKSADPSHLGWLAAAGPGELTVAPTSEIGGCNVRWEKSMTLNPENAEEHISLKGPTFIESKLYGIITSDNLDVWLKPNPQSALSPAPLSHASPASALASPSLSSTSFIVDRLRASKNVKLTSSQINANVDEMQLWLVHAPPPQPAIDESLSLSDSAGNPMYQFIAPPQPNANPSIAQNATPLSTVLPPAYSNPVAVAPPTSNQGPINVEGTLLQSKVIVANKQSWIDSLTVDGPLKVYGTPTAASPHPWNIDGNLLKLSTNSTGQAIVEITGNMARIAMGETWIQGPVIQYDQVTGHIWMDQLGEFSIPTTALNRVQPADIAAGNLAGNIAGNMPGNPAMQASPSSIQWVKAPHCSWKGRLMFDGAVALIEGDIELTGMFRTEADRFWSTRGTCQQMEIHLSNPINLQAPKAASASLDRVVLKDTVDIIASQNDRLGNRLSLERIVVPVLTYHLPQSQLVGAGPGWIRSWHLASLQLGQMASSSSDRPQAKQEIQGAHLSFRESMVAQMDTSEVRFNGKVELAAGPLQSWDDMIDLNTMQRLKVDEMLLNCDMLKAYDTSGLGARNSSYAQNNATWEFEALGNVRFAGKAIEGDYSGNGYRVTYTQAKDLLMIEGDGRIPAHIRREVAPNSREQNFEADVISAAINVKTMAAQDVRITRVGIEIPKTQALPIAPEGASQPLNPNSNPNSAPATVNPRSPAWLRGGGQ